MSVRFSYVAAGDGPDSTGSGVYLACDSKRYLRKVMTSGCT